jgi:probable phosphoglycerate mutase
MILAIIRHASTDWSEKKILQGRSDTHLNDRGIKQAKSWKIPEQFIDYKWYASPLQRAQQTARILTKQNIAIAPELIELDWGDWGGHSIPALQQRYGCHFSKLERLGIDMQPPKGESPRQVNQRVQKWISNCTEPSIVVSHKGVIRCLLSLATGWDMTHDFPTKMSWDAVHLFDISQPNRPKIHKLNVPFSV